MPEQDVKAGELNKAEEVLDVVFPSGDEAAEVVHPRIGTFGDQQSVSRMLPRWPSPIYETGSRVDVQIWRYRSSVTSLLHDTALLRSAPFIFDTGRVASG